MRTTFLQDLVSAILAFYPIFGRVRTGEALLPSFSGQNGDWQSISGS